MDEETGRDPDILLLDPEDYVDLRERGLPDVYENLGDGNRWVRAHPGLGD